jgi:hypothetical protein
MFFPDLHVLFCIQQTKNMKSSLTDILVKALFGKKISKQQGIHENYWGSVITDVYPDHDDGIGMRYLIITNAEGNNIFMIDVDFELEVE